MKNSKDEDALKSVFFASTILWYFCGTRFPTKMQLKPKMF